MVDNKMVEELKFNGKFGYREGYGDCKEFGEFAKESKLFIEQNIEYVEKR